MHPRARWDPATPFLAFSIIYDRSFNHRFEEFMIPGDGWTEVTLPAGPDVYMVDIAGGEAYYDDLTWTAAVTDPTGKDQCRKGGWEAFGFRNQGQCVRFVETGRDGR